MFSRSIRAFYGKNISRLRRSISSNPDVSKLALFALLGAADLFFRGTE